MNVRQPPDFIRFDRNWDWEHLALREMPPVVAGPLRPKPMPRRSLVSLGIDTCAWFGPFGLAAYLLAAWFW